MSQVPSSIFRRSAGTTVQASVELPFSLLGGPMHRVGYRLGLVRDGTNTVLMGMAIALPLWLVLMALALIDGYDVVSYATLGAHARVLLVIPLMFVAESVLDPRLAEVVRSITRSGVVPAPALPALDALVARVTRLKDAWLPEVLCLMLAVALSWLLPAMQIHGTVGYGVDVSTLLPEATSWWYLGVCLTVMRFLMLRWLWRLILWIYCLWRISRLPLRLLPGHPDRAAGLGYFEAVHAQFAPLVMAVSAGLSASFAVEIGSGKLTFEGTLPGIGVLLLVDAALFVAPLLVFMPALRNSRLQGLRDYTALAERYVRDFESKWLRTVPGAHEPVLGSGDIQSLADLGSSFERVNAMRIAPVSLRLVSVLLVAALLPLAPLVLFKYPLIELAHQLLARLTGM